MEKAPVSIDEFMPLQPWIYDRLRHDDRFLVSFPRSGRNWLSIMIAAAISEANLDELRDRSDIRHVLHSVCPPLEGVAESWREKAERDCVNETFLRTHGWKRISPTRNSIYLFRKPDDALVSYFHYASENSLVPPSLKREEFVWGNLTWWILHLKHLVDLVKEQPAEERKWLIVSYEMLHDDPVEILNVILQHLGFSFSRDRLVDIVGWATPERTFAANTASLQSRPGSGARILPRQSLKAVLDNAQPLYEEADGIARCSVRSANARALS